MVFWDDWKQRLAGVKTLGFERPRRTIAALALAFFAVIFLLTALNAPPEWRQAWGGLTVCYLAAFLALGSEWFWGRWFASGLAWSGLMLGVYVLVMVGWVPQLVVYAGLHGLILVMLLGDKVAALYEGQTAWRARYQLDEPGVARLGKTITRASGSLPAVIVWALGPRTPSGLSGFGISAVSISPIAWVLPVLVVLGLWLLLRARTAGLFVLAAGALIGVAGTLLGPHHASPLMFADTFPAASGVLMRTLTNSLVLAGPLLLAAALVPFAGPILRALTRQRG